MKNKRLIFFIAAFFCIIGYAFFFWQNQEKREKEEYLKNEQTFYQKLAEKQTQLDMETTEKREENQKTEIIYFLPNLNDTETLNAIVPLLKENFKKLPSGKKNVFEKFVFIPEKKQKHPNVAEYTFHVTQYSWHAKDKRWEEKQLADTAATLINQTNGQTLTLGDLFGSQSHLLSVEDVIARTLLKNSTAPKDEVKAILDLPQLSMNDTNFDYNKESVTLYYPENKLKLQKYSIDFQDIGAFLNPTFVEEKYLQTLPEKSPDEGKKYIALTFDDGPSNKTTEKLLEILKKEKVVATFFLLGQQVEKFPEITNKIAKDGHELGNHSFSHKNFVENDATVVREEVNRTQSAIYKATGILPNLMRPPYGSINQEKAAIVGMPLALWSVDSLDWSYKNAEKTINEVKKNSKANSIVLMHDIHEDTIKAFPKLIRELKKDGYKFVTVSQLINTTPEPMYAYYSANDFRAVP